MEVDEPMAGASSAVAKLADRMESLEVAGNACKKRRVLAQEGDTAMEPGEAAPAAPSGGAAARASNLSLHGGSPVPCGASLSDVSFTTPSATSKHARYCSSAGASSHSHTYRRGRTRRKQLKEFRSQRLSKRGKSELRTFLTLPPNIPLIAPDDDEESASVSVDGRQQKPTVPSMPPPATMKGTLNPTSKRLYSGYDADESGLDTDREVSPRRKVLPGCAH
ncbi:hypothetical protein DIPPA_07353 [Diplonema papillatum]|nr:hypothetical protein DIPPA_07353 [Diplonema papillatum]